MSSPHGALTPAASREAIAVFAIRRILCPVDFSEESRRALEHAVAIARRWGAQLDVLHVYQAASPFDIVPPDDDTAAQDPQLDMLRTALNDFVQPIAGDAAVTLRLRHGTAARRPIVREADEIDADLLIIGSHGRSGLERFLLGSTSDSIVKTATCPVLVVPSGAGPAHDGRFRRILCGIDFSAPSLRAYRYAVRLAAADEADLTLLHAIEVPPELRDRQVVAAFDVEAVRAATEAAARRRLEALSPGSDAPAIPIRAHVSEGYAHRRIVDTAQHQHVDLIVLGTHGRNVLDRWMFGSNTRAVLRDAPCPVLTVAPA
jgi:nucleotide-binding universal stress UspA family protein